MNQAYLRLMRLAAPIMLVIAILVAVASVVHAVLILQEFGQGQTSVQLSTWTKVAFMIVSAFETAALPFFGAAALWRADRWLALREGAGQ